VADVLVVDDDPEVRALLDAILVRGGHRVRTAATAEEALLASAEARADLMLLDLSLPGLDGDEFLTWLDRGLGRPRALVIVSARPPSQVADVASRHGARHLVKPFRPHELDSVVALADLAASGDGDVALLP
jgi:CheY-like chemotaxis protein